MLKHLIGVFLLSLLTTTANGSNDSDQFLTLWGASYHASNNEGQCETNPGIGYQRFISDTTYLTTGIYKNSSCNTAPYVGVGYEMSITDNNTLSIGGMTGFVGGYDNQNFSSEPFLPLMPYIRISPTNHYHFKLFILPKNDPITAINLNIKF